MKSLFFNLVFMLVLASCATTPQKEMISYIEKPKADCIRLGDISAIGFSLIPPVASAFAKSMLEEKATEFKANSIRIDSQSGIFQVEIKATGFRCADVVSNSPVKKRGK